MAPESEEAAALLVYRLAAADVLRAARDLAAGARQLEAAAGKWDPAGEKQDLAVCALMESAEGMLGLVAVTLPGMFDNAASNARGDAAQQGE